MEFCPKEPVHYTSLTKQISTRWLSRHLYSTRNRSRNSFDI